MIRGMTGFGSTQLSAGKVRAIVEVKSVNHRYFDINYFLPIGFGSVENKIHQIVRKQIERGRVTASIKIVQRPGQSTSLNKEVVGCYLRYGRQLAKEHHLKNDLGLSDLIRLPGVLDVRESHVTPQDVWPDLEKCLQRALASLVNMRKREGKSLAADVADKLKRMLMQVKKIQKKTKSILAERKKKMSAEEFKAFQKSCDINEEISRLTHYIGEQKLLLKSQAAVGKKIDFIAQEMQRETNTIGSKLQDKVVSNAVIALKSKIEKIREQGQNIE